MISISTSRTKPPKWSLIASILARNSFLVVPLVGEAEGTENQFRRDYKVVIVGVGVTVDLSLLSLLDVGSNYGISDVQLEVGTNGKPRLRATENASSSDAAQTGLIMVAVDTTRYDGPGELDQNQTLHLGHAIRWHLLMERFKIRIARFLKDDSGATTVEMAVIFLPLMILVLTIFEIAIAYHFNLTAQKSAQLGARFLAARDPLHSQMPETNAVHYAYGSYLDMCYQGGGIATDACLDPGGPWICDGASLDASCDIGGFAEMMAEMQRPLSEHRR